jgi:shikimate kinase
MSASGPQGPSQPLFPGSSASDHSCPAVPLLPCISNVYLCGMIGCGKTAIGERLAARLGRPFYDLDREIDRELGYSFHRLVQEQGWLKFRELEYEICRRVARMQSIVVALGGGTVRYAWNTDALYGTGITILLEAEFKTLADRVRRADRPRVNTGVPLEEDLERIWADAGHLYSRAADVVYRTDTGKEVETEVNDLLAILDQHGIM